MIKSYKRDQMILNSCKGKINFKPLLKMVKSNYNVNDVLTHKTLNDIAGTLDILTTDVFYTIILNHAINSFDIYNVYDYILNLNEKPDKREQNFLNFAKDLHNKRCKYKKFFIHGYDRDPLEISEKIEKFYISDVIDVINNAIKILEE